MTTLDHILPPTWHSAFETRLGKRTILVTWTRYRRPARATSAHTFLMRYYSPAWPEAGIAEPSRAEIRITTDGAFRALRYATGTPAGKVELVFLRGDRFRLAAPGQKLRTGSTAGAQLMLPANSLPLLSVALRLRHPWAGRLELPFFSPESLQVMPYSLERHGTCVTTSLGEEIRLERAGWIREMTLAGESVRVVARELPWPRWRDAPHGRARAATPRLRRPGIVPVDVKLRSGSDRFGGTLSLPGGAMPTRAAALFLGGSGSYDREGGGGPFDLGYGALLDRLAASGIATLRYDKQLDVADEPRYERLLARARTGLQVLRARRELRGVPIFVIGHSEGGLLALEVAARDRALAGVVLLATAGRRFEAVLLDQLAAQARRLGMGRDWLARGESELRELFHHARHTARWTSRSVPARLLLVRRLRRWYRSLDARDPGRLIATLRCPVLVVQGRDDVQVEVGDARLLHRAARAAGGRASLLLLAHHDHLLRRVTENRGLATYSDRRRRISSVVFEAMRRWMLKTAGAVEPNHNR
jgi:pimeloyl-ACP methyl ester carboxylesterase